jgi:hypothetical protein
MNFGCLWWKLPGLRFRYGFLAVAFWIQIHESGITKLVTVTFFAMKISADSNRSGRKKSNCHQFRLLPAQSLQKNENADLRGLNPRKSASLEPEW